MTRSLFLLACVLACVTTAQAGPGDKTSSQEVIQVQVTGTLSGPPTEASNATKKTFAGAVYAGGRELPLDCAGNPAATEVLRKAYADLSKHTGYVPTKQLLVKGRLEFRPYVRYDAKGKQIEHTDTMPVIVVESVKLVE